jgi:hypothetical protein
MGGRRESLKRNIESYKQPQAELEEDRRKLKQAEGKA